MRYGEKWRKKGAWALGTALLLMGTAVFGQEFGGFDVEISTEGLEAAWEGGEMSGSSSDEPQEAWEPWEREMDREQEQPVPEEQEAPPVQAWPEGDGGLFGDGFGDAVSGRESSSRPASAGSDPAGQKTTSPAGAGTGGQASPVVTPPPTIAPSPTAAPTHTAAPSPTSVLQTPTPMVTKAPTAGPTAVPSPTAAPAAVPSPSEESSFGKDEKRPKVRMVHKKRLNPGEIPEISVQTRAGVQLLSFRMDGREIPWEKRGKSFLAKVAVQENSRSIDVLFLLDGRWMVPMETWELSRPKGP